MYAVGLGVKCVSLRVPLPYRKITNPFGLRTLRVGEEASIFNTIMTDPNLFPLELEKKEK